MSVSSRQAGRPPGYLRGFTGVRITASTQSGMGHPGNEHRRREGQSIDSGRALREPAPSLHGEHASSSETLGIGGPALPPERFYTPSHLDPGRHLGCYKHASASAVPAHEAAR